ncbi:MAG: hypothetical protein JRE64_17735 [Deltaproteobacteria bacterium]|nr:hypothetical protein [Deltaproteobacteria bacterium]
MAIHKAASLLHWNYFLALESDVERLSRFVEFTSINFGTYSIEIAHLFLAASSEVDVVAKQLCNRIDVVSNAEKINQYRKVIKKYLPGFSNGAITIPRYGLEFRPWSDWINDSTPDWWKAHNSVKHQRDESFESANLENVLKAMAGLFMLILHYYRAIDTQRIEPPPSLFSPPPDLATVCQIMGRGMALVFKD